MLIHRDAEDYPVSDLINGYEISVPSDLYHDIGRSEDHGDLESGLLSFPFHSLMLLELYLLTYLLILLLFSPRIGITRLFISGGL